jgi:hypothetical protein
MTARPAVPPETPAGWRGSDLAADPDRWTRPWSPEELDDLFELARRVAGPDLDGDLTELAVQGQAGARLQALAAEIRAELISGLRFILLKGYPIGTVDRRLEAIGFLVLGWLLGTPRSQNAAGHLLGHVKDVGGDLADPGTRIYQTNERQSFHTDSTDAVGLLCRRTARSGGRSLLASAETAYRIMVARRPDLAPLLFEPVATDRRGEVPEGAQPWFEIPVLSWYDDQLTVIYQRTYIDSAARFPDAPPLSPQQIEALDCWDAIVNEPDVHLAMDLEPGDIQFVHNHSLLHDRTGFIDHPEPERRRHLLRLWLSLPGDRRLPPVFQQRYGDLTVGRRGGIVLSHTKLSVPLDVG